MLSNKIIQATFKILEENFLLSDFQKLSNIEKNNLFEIFYDSRLSNYILSFLKKNSLLNKNDKYHLKILNNSSYHTSKTFLTFLESKRITKNLNTRNINFIMLKGIHLLNEHYHDLTLRPIRDIDILVKEEEIDLVVQHLKKEGYKFITKYNKESFQSYSKYSYDIPPMANNDGIIIELHHRISMPSDSKQCIYLDHFFTNKKEIVCDDVRVPVLSNEDLVLHLTYHAMSKQGMDVGISFIKDLINIFISSDLDFKLMIKRAKLFGLYNKLSLIITILDQNTKIVFNDGIQKAINNNIDKSIINKTRSLLICNKVNGMEYKIIESLMNIRIRKIFSAYTEKSIIREFNVNAGAKNNKLLLLIRFKRHLRTFINIFKKSFLEKGYLSDLKSNILVIKKIKNI